MTPGGLIVIDDVQHIRKSALPNIQKAFVQGQEDNLRLYVPTSVAAIICKDGGKLKPKGDGKKIGAVYLYFYKETIEI